MVYVRGGEVFSDAVVIEEKDVVGVKNFYSFCISATVVLSTSHFHVQQKKNCKNNGT